MLFLYSVNSEAVDCCTIVESCFRLTGIQLVVR